MDAHHKFPQATRFEAQWNRVGININHPKNMSWWQTESHISNAIKYNKAWDKFFKNNPSAILKEMKKFGSNLMKDYGF